MVQVTNFRPTKLVGTVKHCVNQYMVLFHYCSLEGDTAMPGWLHARLCDAFLVVVGVLQYCGCCGV